MLILFHMSDMQAMIFKACLANCIYEGL